MEISLEDLFSHPSDNALARAAKFGFASLLMRSSIVHANCPISYLWAIIEPAINHNFIKFFFNIQGDPVAYVVWAFVAPDVESRFIETGRWNFHESEWNEGDQAWIIDFVSPFGNIKNIFFDLKLNEFSGIENLRYYRIKNRKVVLKKIDLNRI